MNKKRYLTEEKDTINHKDWLMSRQSFVKTLLLSGIALQLPWLESCSTDIIQDFGDITPLSRRQFETVRLVQNVLFPPDGNGPGALQINADRYLTWVLKDPLLDPDEGTFIIKNIDAFNEKCEKKYATNFSHLSEEDQTTFIQSVARIDWGKKWMSRLLTLIFEALLLDPQYGGNTNNEGRNWLEHDPGNPRPTNKLIYPEIMKLHEI